MARTPKEITDAELAVMNLIWERGRITTHDLVGNLYPASTRSHYEVLQGLLHRLERKGFVKRDRKPVPHLFEPKIEREDLIGRFLQKIADQLCGGSVTPLLRYLVNADFTSGQPSTIRDLINGTQGGGKARRCRIIAHQCDAVQPPCAESENSVEGTCFGYSQRPTLSRTHS